MNKRTGLTLLEVILSIAILAIVVVIFLGIQTFSLKTTRSAADSQDLVRAAEVAVERVTGRYISGEFVENIEFQDVDVVVEQCRYVSEEIDCRIFSPRLTNEVGIFITATARKGDLQESLYRFVRLP